MVRTVTLNRPKAANALDPSTMQGLTGCRIDLAGRLGQPIASAAASAR